MKTLAHLLFQAMHPQRNRLIRGGGFTAVALLAVTAAGQPAPPNDMFTNAVVITGLITTVTGSNVGATKEPGEPIHAGNAGGKSVWWTWTAPTSDTVTLYTIGSPIDTLLAVYIGDSVANLSLVATNDDLSYGSVASKLTFSAAGGAVYRIAVDGYGGDSGDIVLNLWLGPRPPQITAQPKGAAVVVGANATFTVPANSSTPMSYQWYKGGASIAGAISTSYSIANAQASDSGSYSVVVSNTVGSVVSSNAVLTVGPVIITAQPLSMTVAAGYPAAFGVTASGTHPVSYQWQKDDVAIAGATNTSYRIASAQPTDAGAYSVVVSNDLAVGISSNAVLTLITPYVFTTFAGRAGKSGTNDGTGSAARFNGPHGVATDNAGNVYVAEDGNHAIRKITPNGAVITLAGLAGTSGATDGPASVARFFSPWGVAVDGATNVYVADANNHTIRKITPDGLVSTLAGLPGTPGNVDGSNSVALLNTPSDVAVDSTGTVYVSDWQNNKIRKITPEGAVTTLAGLGPCCGGDRRWTKARFCWPAGVAVDPAGNVYVADECGDKVRKVRTDGEVTTLAGSSLGGGSADGIGSAAQFEGPHGGTLDSAGNLYVADTGNGTVRRITPGGVVTTLAGRPRYSGTADGAGWAARFSAVRGVAVDGLGNLYVTDYDNHTIRKGVPFAVNPVPQSQAVLAGTSVILSAAASGDTGPFTCQWLFGGVPLAGQTNTTLALGPVWRTNSGVYSVVVSNAVGNWITLNATVRALVPPVIHTPQVTGNGTFRLRFQDADGGLPFDLSQVAVQWRTNLPSGTDTHWQTITAGFSVTNGFVVFEDTNVLSAPTCFYRILER